MPSDWIKQRLDKRLQGAGNLGMPVGGTGDSRAEPKPHAAASPRAGQVVPQAIADRVRQRLAAQASQDVLQAYRTDPKAREQVVRLVQGLIREEAAVLGKTAGTGLTEQLLADLLGYGPIQPLVDDPDVTEIMVNGPDQVWMEQGGTLQPAPVRFRNQEHLRNVIEHIVAAVGRRIDESTPLADARLPDGSRVNAVLLPIALDGPYLTIRKFGHRLTALELVERGTLTRDVLDFLAACVQARSNVIVSGGTGSGKTSLLNVLSSFIPEDERIITIEDAAELRLQQPHVVRMETRPAPLA